MAAAWFPREVKNRTRVRVYVGTAEVLARLTLLDAETLQAGQSGLIQLRLESPAVCATTRSTRSKKPRRVAGRAKAKR